MRMKIIGCIIAIFQQNLALKEKIIAQTSSPDKRRKAAQMELVFLCSNAFILLSKHGKQLFVFVFSKKNNHCQSFSPKHTGRETSGHIYTCKRKK